MEKSSVVEVKDPIENKTYKYYLDRKLKKSLDQKVRPSLSKTQDEDYVLLIDGRERTGKSTFGMQIGKYIDPTLSLDRVCFSPDEFKQAILKAKKKQCVIYDEAYRGLGSAGALTEVNRILKGMMMEMGQKNLFVIVILPTFYVLEKYVALFRARGLLHVFKSRGRKGYWRFFNTKKKQMLYLNPIGKRYYTYFHVRTGFKGRFYSKYVIDEQEYRDKKDKSFKQGYKLPRQEKFKEQRDKLLYSLYVECRLSLSQLSDMCNKYKIKLNKTILSEIVKKQEYKEDN